MYKQYHGGNMNDLLPQHNYPTRTNEHLRVPQHNLSIFQRSLAYSGPHVWNSIPNQIKTLPTLNSFKKQFKNYILSQY